MVSKHELRSYQDADGWESRNLVLGSILAAALLVMAAAGSTMASKPYVGKGGVYISASLNGTPTRPLDL
jgi:hypothetical protein